MTNPSSLSTKTGRAPVATIAPTVAINVFGVVITSSPGPTPSRRRGKLRASVPVPTPTACGMPLSSAKRRSNCSTAAPSVNSPDRTSARTSSRYASISANCRSRYEKLTRKRVSFRRISCKCGYLGCNDLTLLRRELWIHRDAHDAFRLPLGHREVPSAIPEWSCSRLQMNRHWIVDCRADAGRCKVSAERVALLSLDDERVIHAALVGAFRRSGDAIDVCESYAIGLRVAAAGLGPLLRVSKLDEQGRGLNRVEPRVRAPHHSVLSTLEPDVSQQTKLSSRRLIVGGQDAAVPDGIQRLEGMEAEAADVSE